MLRIYSNKLQPPVPLPSAQGQPSGSTSTPQTMPQNTIPDQQAEEAWRIYEQMALAAQRGNPQAIAKLNEFHRQSEVQRPSTSNGMLDKNSFKKYYGNRTYKTRFRTVFDQYLQQFKSFAHQLLQPVLKGTPLPER